MKDGNYLVRRSVEVENPIILISINYRLGLFGFFTSKELKEEAKQNGEDGFSNQGLHDQRLALQWVCKRFSELNTALKICRLKIMSTILVEMATV